MTDSGSSSTDDSSDSASNSVLGSAVRSKTSQNAASAHARAEAEGERSDQKEVKFNARVPRHLREAFREICEQEGRSMSWVVREYMRRAVREGETGL